MISLYTESLPSRSRQPWEGGLSSQRPGVCGGCPWAFSKLLSGLLCHLVYLTGSELLHSCLESCRESWLFLCCAPWQWHHPGFQRVKNSKLVMVMENLAWLGPKEFVRSALKSWCCQLRNPVGSSFQYLFTVTLVGWFHVSHWKSNKRH